MPLYDYRCPNGHDFEALVARDETPACPECGDPNPKRLPSTFTFNLVGPGWAKDGYAKRQERKP